MKSQSYATLEMTFAVFSLVLLLALVLLLLSCASAF